MTEQEYKKLIELQRARIDDLERASDTQYYLIDEWRNEAIRLKGEIEELKKRLNSLE